MPSALHCQIPPKRGDDASNSCAAPLRVPCDAHGTSHANVSANQAAMRQPSSKSGSRRIAAYSSIGARRTGSSSGIAQAGLTQPPSGKLVAGAGVAFGALLVGAAAGSDLVALRGSTGETGGGDG